MYNCINSRQGLSLIELMIAMSIIAIVVMALVSTQLRISALNTLTADEMAASNASRDKIAVIWEELSKNGFNETCKWCETADNQTFDVKGLSPYFPDTSVGQVIPYFNETRIPLELGAAFTTYTNSDGYEFGSLDLDGNDSAVTDHASPTNGDYSNQILPVEIRIRWNNRGNPVVFRKFMMFPRTIED